MHNLPIVPPMLFSVRALSLPMMVCLAVAGCLVGCGAQDGAPLGTVTGTVTLEGKPVEGVTVQFQPEQGVPSYGTSDEEGKYELAYVGPKMGAEVGRHTVQLSYTGEDSSGDPLPMDIRIPREFGPGSKVVREVEPGQNTFDLEITEPQ